jgi:CO/xanthine dehydrogenase Mo-binding subunit
VTVETDMTDIGTGSHTIIGQTAAEMMGVPLDKVVGSEDRRIPILFLLGSARAEPSR